MENLKAIVLAAGEGTRMKSKKAKVLHKVLNKTMIEYVIGTAKECGAEEVCVVVGFKADDVKRSIKDEKVCFAVQEKQQGTGHAVMQAASFIEDDKDIIILYGDTPLITSSTLKDFLNFHRKQNNGVSIISADVSNPDGYGHIIRDESGNFVKNVEHKDASESEKKICEINTGVYCFKGKALKDALKNLKNDNVQNEYYLPDTLEIILNSGSKVNAYVSDDVTEFFGVNSRVQLSKAEVIMKNRINKRHMENGVTIIDPQSTFIDDTVIIGIDTIIYPGTILAGSTVIGEDCEIGPYSQITNTKIGNKTNVKFTNSIDAIIGDNSTIGPYAYIRPKTCVGNNVKIGDFVEVKNSNLGDGTKVSHLTYIGDSDVGKNINFGCGTVTVNYDGHKKYRTTIEDNAFIGCNTNLIAPVTVKEGAYIAAGSTITKDVPEKSLAVARSRQQNILNWVKKQ